MTLQTTTVELTSLAAPLSYCDIEVELIDVPAGRRALDPNWVETLAGEISARSQRTPIEVIATAGRYRLVSGGHRVAAARLNQSRFIKAIVKQPADFAHEAEIKLAEIVENFMRRELSVLDRAFDVAAWKTIFETVRGAVKRGGDRRSGSKLQVATLIESEALAAVSETFAASFTEAAQKALGLSKDAVFRALRIAQVGDEARQRISLLPIADNQSELIALVGQPPARQSAIIDLLVNGAVSVAEAMSTIDGAPRASAQAGWEKVSERFARLKPAEQEQFFTLYEDAILKWVAARRS